jgi:hypothetical protein
MVSFINRALDEMFITAQVALLWNCTLSDFGAFISNIVCESKSGVVIVKPDNVPSGQNKELNGQVVWAVLLYGRLLTGYSVGAERDSDIDELKDQVVV